MSKPGISLNINNNENNAPSLPTSSPLGDYYSEELRMTSQPFKAPPFDKITNTIDIIKQINNAQIIRDIGKGTRSEGQIIKLQNGSYYILRKTKVLNKKVRDDLLNEQLIYGILEKVPNYTNYISNLLYADVPLIYHKSDAYNNAYFIFEYQEGQTLDRFIEENKDTVSFSDIMMLITGIYKALKFISDNGIIHRDIKPENIFIDKTRNNTPLLFDFDISCRKGIDCKAAEFVGTRKYMTNGAKVIANKNNPFSFTSYEYNHYYDLYALVVIIEHDLIKMTKPEDKSKLLNYANQLKGELKMYGGRKTINRKTIKVGGTRIGVLNPWWGGYKPSGGDYKTRKGGYKPTKRNIKYLKLWKKGKSIGFTMRSSLKAKGLIPRSNGTKRVSPKYS